MDRDKLGADLRPHLSEGAANMAGALLAALRTTHAICSGEATPDVRQAAAQMLVDLAMGASMNPWWRQHGSFVMPVFGAAVARWRGGAALPDVLAEVVSAVAIADVGFAEAEGITARLHSSIQSEG